MQIELVKIQRSSLARVGSNTSDIEENKIIRRSWFRHQTLLQTSAESKSVPVALSCTVGILHRVLKYGTSGRKTHKRPFSDESRLFWGQTCAAGSGGVENLVWLKETSVWPSPAIVNAPALLPELRKRPGMSSARFRKRHVTHVSKRKKHRIPLQLSKKIAQGNLTASCKRLISWFLLDKGTELGQKIVPVRPPKF
ncbi:hypothetical protein TNCV_2636341 [Trichonephila clavipes]|uniref:Uncharacterized protein n=1 Tax=Trichonephila clavipes TaxID=2585209 RepID=A0A8X6R7Q0_TRICX|nr:hypothetical protein TNCV_2636341 [Trichonephila clavipes]